MRNQFHTLVAMHDEEPDDVLPQLRSSPDAQTYNGLSTRSDHKLGNGMSQFQTAAQFNMASIQHGLGVLHR